MRRWLIPFLILFGLLGVASTAMAQANWGYAFENPMSDPRVPKPECIYNDQLQGTLSARAVACMRVLTYMAAEEVVKPIALFMLPIGGAVIFLAIVLFGVRLTLGGVRAPKGEGLLLFFKAFFVLLLLGSLATGNSALNIGRIAIMLQDQLMDWGARSFDDMATLGTKDLLEECKSSLDPAAPGASAVSLSTKSIMMNVKLDNGSTVDMKLELGLWNSIDCIVGMLFGMVRGVAFWTGLASLIMATVMSGPVGISIFMGAIILFFTIILYVIRCVFYIMHAYLAIAVILLFVPLVIPTLMFRRTMNYFSKWLFIYLGVIFQPFILTVFMAVSVFGMSYFIVGDTGERGGLAPASNLNETNNPHGGHVYSLWEILGFKYLRHADPAIQAEMRRLLIRNMVKNDGVSVFDVVDFDKDLSNIAEYLGDDAARQLGELGLEGKEALEAAYNAFKRGASFEEISRSAQSVRAVSLEPIYMPVIDLRVKGTYDIFIKKIQGELKATPANDGLTDPIIQGFRRAGFGGTARQDPDTGAWLRSDGPHPLYLSSTGEVDNNFQEWFLLKLCGAVFSCFIMVFIFLSLNESVPKIARIIAGNGGIAITRGMAKMFSREGAGVAQDSGVPMADRLEGFLNGAEARWKQAYAQQSGTDFNPIARAGNFIRSGFGAGAESASEAILDNTDIGNLIRRAQIDSKTDFKL